MDEASPSYLQERIPRYTSYPTAPHFSPMVGPRLYRDWLRELPAHATLSLYLHVPFCEMLCWYCGCHTSVTRHREPVERYVALLRREIAMIAEHLDGQRVGHVHWGGGTPSIVGPDLFRTVMGDLHAHWDFEPNAERAVEVDPRRITPAMAQAFAKTGINRASLGVQTFTPEAQRAIARVQSLEMTQDCVGMLRAAGIRDINLDLIYGLPHETVTTCETSAQAALSLKPARLSVFGYAHVPHVMKHQRAIDPASLPSSAERLAQEEAIGRACIRAGYVRIGLDHYALPGDPMAIAMAEGRLRRNFQGYTTDEADALIGFGASAISRLPNGYAQNAAGLRDWMERIEAGLPATARGIALRAEDRLRAVIIERLMCDLRADLPALLALFGYPSDWLDPEVAELSALEREGLVYVESGIVSVPESSRNLVRKVASVFDTYLDPSHGRHAVLV